jgi:hypothetical protein
MSTVRDACRQIVEVSAEEDQDYRHFSFLGTGERYFVGQDFRLASEIMPLAKNAVIVQKIINTYIGVQPNIVTDSIHQLLDEEW